jgi:NaMN:DMB phosphoribosyltransferase
VVREGVGAGGEMTQALYAHMNNKRKKKKLKIKKNVILHN